MDDVNLADGAGKLRKSGAAFFLSEWFRANTQGRPCKSPPPSALLFMQHS
ncbi:hypothetical protein [Chlorobaculum sp. 24CR]|nr:hypothetical protein [Chlorobaculum sp. 24CR]